MEHGSLWAAVCEQRLDDLPVRVAVVDLHGQVQLLGERDMLAEGVSLQFLRASPVRNRSMPVSPMATT